MPPNIGFTFHHKKSIKVEVDGYINSVLGG